MSDIKFVGLHAHSLSMGDSIGYPEDHFKFVLENGGDGLAVTDHGTAIAWGYLQQAKNSFKKKGIPFKAIFGAELYYHPDLDEWAEAKRLLDEEPQEAEGLVIEVESDSKEKLYWADPIKRRHHLVVLVQNIEGYHNLCRIITESYRKGFYRYPRTDRKTLEKYNKGLIISTACIHPDAKIQTEYGPMSMSEVVNHIGLSVLSYNEETKQTEMKKVVWGDKTRRNAKLLKICLKDGRELKLTPDHKVFTNEGWMEAQYLTKDHKILAL